MTSCAEVAGRSAAAGEATSAHLGEPAAALSAVTRVCRAWSRSLPNLTEFSISSSETIEASRVLMAATILACWRWRFTSFAAPRGPLSPQSFAVIALPSRSV